MKAHERETLLRTLQDRFGKTTHRHAGLAWSKLLPRREADPDALRSWHGMETTGGEPDVIGRDDAEARPAREQHPRETSAAETAAARGLRGSLRA